MYKAEVKGESKHNIEEGNVVWVPIDAVGKRKEKFIPTDWLIVKSTRWGILQLPIIGL